MNWFIHAQLQVLSPPIFCLDSSSHNNEKRSSQVSLVKRFIEPFDLANEDSITRGFLEISQRRIVDTYTL